LPDRWLQRTHKRSRDATLRTVSAALQPKTYAVAALTARNVYDYGYEIQDLQAELKDTREAANRGERRIDELEIKTFRKQLAPAPVRQPPPNPQPLWTYAAARRYNLEAFSRR
jgi:hypothetical protein